VLGGICDDADPARRSSALESDCDALRNANTGELATVLQQITPDMASVPVR